jgi:hypothetical protein
MNCQKAEAVKYFFYFFCFSFTPQPLALHLIFIAGGIIIIT